MSQAVGTIDPRFYAYEIGKTNSVTAACQNLARHRPLADRRLAPEPPQQSMAQSEKCPMPARPRRPTSGCFWIEESAGLNDAAFAMEMVNPDWHDMPGTYHNIGCGFAFADGHSETHRWQFRAPKQLGVIDDPKDQTDWTSMASHTSARVN